jgi:hypothetical protein
MPQRMRKLGLAGALALSAIACSAAFDLGLPGQSTAGPSNGQEVQISTAVAGTLQALTQEAATPTPTATPVAQPTFAVPSTALLSVSVATACYAGPSSQYGFVITMRPGMSATVIGQDAADRYWVIEAPGYPGTVCWISGEYAQLTGDTTGLPSPATPPPSIYTLSEPRNLRVICSEDNSEWTVTLRWTNTEPDQTAVRIFRNGRHVATLGAHASSFSESISHHRRRGLTYGVQAYSGSAVSSIVSAEARRCK